VTSYRFENDQSLNRTEYSASFDGRRVGERSSWVGRFDYVRDTTLTSELGLSGITQVDRDHEARTLTVAPSFRLSERGRISIQTGWSQSRYEKAENTGLTDYDYGSASIAGDYSLWQGASLGLSGSGGVVRVPDFGTTSRNYAAQLTFRADASELWSWSVGVGPSRITTDIAEDDGLEYRFDASRRTERVSIGIEAVRSVIATGRGVLSKRLMGTIAGSAQIASHTSISLNAQWSRNEEIVSSLGAESDHRYVAASSTLSHQLFPSWTVWILGGWEEQASSRDERSANRWRGGLGFSWRPGSRPL
jgi:hypothetical protein